MIQGSWKPNGDALTMKIDGCDANRQGLADAKERVGIDGTGGGGVGTRHGGDVEKSVATDAEVEKNAEGDDVSDDGVGDDGVGAGTLFGIFPKRVPTYVEGLNDIFSSS